MKRDLYQTVTDKIVAQMETGVMPWVQGWQSTGLSIPMNAVTERPYSGINVLLFWMARDAGYAKPRYLTFKQAQDCGGNVRKGEHGMKVYYFKPLLVKDKDGEEKQIPMLREYTVFNVAQCENLPDKIVHGGSIDVRNQDERETDADAFLATTGADIREGAGVPCYVPSRDLISLPPYASFVSRQAFYATAFHEITHWTGAKHRLDRNLSTRFSSHGYALEELVAELGAAFLCAEFGFDIVSRSASYLDRWLPACKEHPRAIFTAASKASKAAEYLRGLAIADPIKEVA